MIKYWIERGYEVAVVCFKNTDTERTEAYTARGPLASERARIWAFDNGCGLL